MIVVIVEDVHPSLYYSRMQVNVSYVAILVTYTGVLIYWYKKSRQRSLPTFVLSFNKAVLEVI